MIRWIAMTERVTPLPSNLGFPWIKVVLGAIVFAILIALGTWQVERLYWKEGLLAEIDARTHAKPSSLAEIERSLGG